MIELTVVAGNMDELVIQTERRHPGDFDPGLLIRQGQVIEEALFNTLPETTYFSVAKACHNRIMEIQIQGEIARRLGNQPIARIYYPDGDQEIQSVDGNRDSPQPGEGENALEDTYDMGLPQEERHPDDDTEQ